MWKDAFLLAMVEIKKSRLNVLLSWIGFTVIGIGVVLIYNNIKSPDPYHDFLLIGVVAALPLFMRRKLFRSLAEEKLRASASIVHYVQLPIPKEVIARSQVFIYLLFCLPLYITVFGSVYFIDETLGAIPMMTYGLFMLVILTGSCFFGLSLLLGDYGYTKLEKVYGFVFGIAIFVGIMWLKFNDFVYGKGITLRLLDMVQAYPARTVCLSVVVMVLSVWLFPKCAVRKLQRLDY